MKKPRLVTDDFKISEVDRNEELFKSKPMDPRCPRGLKCLPTEPCPMALNSIYGQGSSSDQCPWFVVHGAARYCFWAYQALHNRPHTLEETRTLLHLSRSSADQIERRALETLKKRLKDTALDISSQKD